MRFGSPLVALQGTAPAQKLATAGPLAAGGALLPQGGGYYDVSGFSAVMLSTTPNGYGVGQTTALQLQFFDNSPSHNPIGNFLAMPAPFTINAASGGQLIAYRTIGPAMRVLVNAVPAGASLTVNLYGLNSELRFDGPYSPAMEGEEVQRFSGAFGANTGPLPVAPAAFVTGYCGPAKLFVYGAAGGPVSAYVNADSSGFASQGVVAAVPPAGSLNIGAMGLADVWLPAEPYTLFAFNGGVAQTVTVVLTAA